MIMSVRPMRRKGILMMMVLMTEITMLTLMVMR